MKKIWLLFKKTFTEWSEDKAARLAAALSYYTIFSIPPLLVIIIAIAGLVFGQSQAQESIMAQMTDLFGAQTSDGIASMLEGARHPGTGILATVIGVIVLLLGASGVFGQLQDSLNTIWDVKLKPGQGIMGMIRKRFFSFAMVLGVGFLLLVSLVVTTLLSALGTTLLGLFPGREQIIQVVNWVISFLIITILFALTYKYVPDAKIAWKDVWLGAAVTSLLFTLGKMAIGIYLGHSSFSTTFGAAASVIIILVWVYYSAQILFLGAEFTQVFANVFGSKIVPDEDAERLTEEDRANQGIPSRSRAGIPAASQPIPVTALAGVPALPPPAASRPSVIRLLQAASPFLVALGVGILGSVRIVRDQKQALQEQRLVDCG